MFRPADIDAFNTDVSKWSADTFHDLQNEIDAQGIIHREGSRSPVPAKKALKRSSRKSAGVITRLSYRMPRHMVFRHKGVGRGTKISEVGSTNRKPAPWFNPVVEKNISQLVDIVADHQGAMVLNAVMIK